MGVRHRIGWTAVLGAVLLAGCVGSESAGDTVDGATEQLGGQGTVDDASPSIDVTEMPDDPDDVDAAYLQAVVDELQELLYATDIDAAAVAPLDEQGLPADVVARYRAALSPAQATSWIDNQEIFLADPDDVAMYAESLRDVGVPVWEVEPPPSVSDDCIPFAYTYSLEHDQAPPDAGVAALRPLDADRDPEGHNPTGWVLGLHGDPERSERLLSEYPELERDEVFTESVTSVCQATREADEAAAEADAAL